MKRKPPPLSETAASLSFPSHPPSPPSPPLLPPTAPPAPLLRRPLAFSAAGPHLRIANPPISLFLSAHYRSLGLLPPSALLSSLSHRGPSYHLSPQHLLQSLHTSSITSLSLESIESRYLLSADTHGLVALYDTLPPLTPPPAPTPPLSTSSVTTGRGGHYAVNGLCWYPVDTGMFITGGTDGKVHTWDTNTFSISHSFTLRDASVNAVAMSGVSAAHSLIAVSSTDSNVRLCDLQSAGFAHTLIGHMAEVTTAAWTPFSEFLLVTGSVDQTIRMWDIRRSGCLVVFDQWNASSTASLTSRYTSRPLNASASRDITSHSAAVCHVAFTPLSSLLLSLGTDSRLRLWNPFTCTNLLTHFSVNNRYRYARFDVSRGMGGRERVWVGSGKDVREVEVKEGGAGRKLAGHFHRVNVVCVNDKWDEVYSGGVDHSLLVWGRKDEGKAERGEGLLGVEALQGQEGAAVDESEGFTEGADRDEWSDEEG